MRKLIIDTDGGADDAVAILLALRSSDVEVLALTTVGGNVNVDQATRNTLAIVEAGVGQTPPVYRGTSKPLFRVLECATYVHGADGLGDCGLSCPKSSPAPGHGVDAILDLVRQNPGEVEIVTIGPATNLALAILKEPETMRLVKHVWSMGTSGFGPGNTTPVAEFNVYVDADAYKILMDFCLPLTVIGYDVCLGDMALGDEEITHLEQSGSPAAVFAMACNSAVRRFHREFNGGDFVSSPDAVAMAACLWPETVKRAIPCFAHVCTEEEATYGQVILDPKEGAPQHTFPFWDRDPNCTVCAAFDTAKYKARLWTALGV